MPGLVWIAADGRPSGPGIRSGRRGRGRAALTPRARLLEGVLERLELGRLLAGRVRQRLCEQPVGEPGIPRQQRAVEVRADRAADAAALEAGLAVVPEAGDDAAERLGAGVEQRAAGVVLEACERPPRPLAVEQHVADHAALAGDRLVREQPDAWQQRARSLAIAAAEQLVAAADGEQGGAALDGRPDRLALPGEVGRDQRLLAILPAADVEQVVIPRAGARPPTDTPSTTSSWPRSAARRESTAMFPRSA